MTTQIHGPSPLRPDLRLHASDHERFRALVALTRRLRDVLTLPSATRASEAASLAHALFQQSAADNPPPQTPACRKGCSHCCRIYVSATAPEIFALARAVRLLPPDGFAATRSRLAAAAAATDRNWSEDIFFSHICPLLENDACVVHPDRPLSCRGLSSFSAEACRISAAALPEGRDEPVPLVQEHAFLRGYYAHVFWAALKAAGLPFETLSVNQALFRVLDDPDAEGRWLRGEDVFVGVPRDTSLKGSDLVIAQATIDSLVDGANGVLDTEETSAPFLSTPAGTVRVRTETVEDQAFRYALFCQSRPDLLLLPEQVRENIMQMQFRAQTLGYRTDYPGASDEIILLEADSVGRIVTHDAPMALCLVDIALIATHRNRGIGTAVIQALLDRAAARGQAVTLSVARGNPAEKLYLRLGFVVQEDSGAYSVMKWRAAPS